MKIDDLVNVFTQEDFIDDPYGRKDSTGNLLRVLPDVGLIYQKFRELGVRYNWVAVTAGRTQEGRAYFVGNLTVFLDDGHYTVPGSAEAPSTKMEISGAATLALQNSALRSLGMAEFLYTNNKVAAATYEKEQVAKPVAQNAAKPVASQSSPAAAAQPKTGYQRQRTAFKKAAPSTQPSVAPQTTGTWTGKEICPFGKHKDQAYELIPTEYLNWASAKERPDEGAKKELARRVAENPPDTTVPDGAGFDWVQ